MKILILGAGGREHAFAWKIAQSKLVEKLFVAPGNAGTSLVAQNIDLGVNDFPGIRQFCREKEIDILLVGPEDPIVKGIADYFDGEKTRVIAPSANAALLEGSKDFAKEFMARHNIPTARHKTVNTETLTDGIRFLRSLSPPYVLKADGLAAGKGVIITSDLNEAEHTLAEMINGMLGDAGRNVVIEEYLNGIELSMFVLTDGNHYLLLPEAKDYKRIGDGDTGPNTGGMGAVSPVPFADDLWKQKVKDRIIDPTIAGLRKEGRRFIGFIFLGLMNVGGDPFVIEYNVRMGDPETEVVIPRIQNDFAEILKACSLGKLDTVKLTTDQDTWLTVIAVSGGYPGEYAKGKRIVGIVPDSSGVVFHSGTKHTDEGLLTNGGRVLAVCGKGKSIPEAREPAYITLKNIVFEGIFYRKDIGLDLI